MIGAKQHKATLLLALLLLPCQLHAAPPQFEIDLKELDRQKPAAAPQPAKKQAPKKKEPAAAAPHAVRKAPASAAQGDFLRYTVKPGDHIFKILMVHFGMSNEAAERLIPEIVRINDIGNIKTLEVGGTLLIPKGKLEHAARPAKKGKPGVAKIGKPAAEVTEAPRAPEPATTAPARAPEPAPAKAPEPAPAKAPEPAPAKAPAPAPAKAPEPAPAKAPEPAPAKAPEPAPAKAPEPAPAKAPAPVPVPVPVAPKVVPPPVATPAAPIIPQAPTWVCSVGQHDIASIVDALLNALSASWSRNRIIQSGQGAPTAFSIRVDRYFEYKGERYIVSIGESDPYNYTLIRLLETSGYRVLRMSGKEDLRSASEKLFKLAGVSAEFGTYPLQEGKQATGFLVQQDDAGGRRVLITDRPATPGHKWVLPAGCGSK